jgi:hypothetical protein
MRTVAGVPVLALVAAALLGLVGCTTASNGLIPPPGDPVRFDWVSLTPDGAAVTLKFVGGKEYDLRDPCSNHYFGWAHEFEGTLDAKIIDDTLRLMPEAAQVACTLEGYSRTVTVQLASPFLGARIRDLAGYVHFVRPPDGLVELTKLLPGWTLVAESDVPDSPTGRWERTWTMGEPPTNGTSKGKIVLYQAFGAPADVTGSERVGSVKVNGTPATLYRYEPDGELVLVWMLAEDGLALVVNETDFPADEAIKLAESASIP